MRSLPIVVAILLCLCLTPVFAQFGDQTNKDSRAAKSTDKAAKDKPRKKSDRKPAAKKPTTAKKPISKRDEREVMKFVQLHHPELRALLLHLKTAKPTHYQRAMRDLHRTRERLDSLQERDMEGYVLELHRWKYKSRAQLLAARLQITHSEQQMEQLRELLNSKMDVDLAIMQRNRDRVSERLEKLEAQIDRQQQRRGELIERQLRALTAKNKRAGDKRGKRTKKKTVTTEDLPATKR